MTEYEKLMLTHPSSIDPHKLYEDVGEILRERDVLRARVKELEDAIIAMLVAEDGSTSAETSREQVAAWVKLATLVSHKEKQP